MASLLILDRASRHYVAADQSNMSLARLHVMLLSACMFSSIRKTPNKYNFYRWRGPCVFPWLMVSMPFIFTRSNGDAKISTAFLMQFLSPRH